MDTFSLSKWTFEYNVTKEQKTFTETIVLEDIVIKDGLSVSDLLKDDYKLATVNKLLEKYKDYKFNKKNSKGQFLPVKITRTRRLKTPDQEILFSTRIKPLPKVAEKEPAAVVQQPKIVSNRQPIGAIIPSTYEGKKYVSTCDVWSELLAKERTKPYSELLFAFVDKEYETKTIYPARKDLLNAFRATPFHKIKVVILGQDPYHDGTAHGLAFSSLNQYIPPSLKIIYEEIQDDYYKGANIKGEKIFTHGNLTQWAHQGVFLINTALTVEKGKAGSHQKKGWDRLIAEVICKIDQDAELPIVFMLWGAAAKEYAGMIVNPKHLILMAAHPQSENYRRGSGFLGCKHFSKANEFLISSRQYLTSTKDVRYQLPINWGIF